MPELAEIETVRRKLDQLLKGKKIKSVTVDRNDRIFYVFAKAEAVEKALTGAIVKGSGRRGKYFWLELNRKPWPLFHLGMSGNFSVLLPKGKKAGHRHVWGGLKLQSEALREATDEPKRLWFCRLLLTMADGTEVALLDPRRFGRMWLEEDPLQSFRLKKLGPDPLHDFPKVAVLVTLLKRRKLSIKALLLNQAVFAGVGNWLADEILFQARLSPHRRADSLSLGEVTRLRKNLLSVIRKAVAVDADYERFPKTWLFHHRWGKSKIARISTGQKIVHEQIGGRTTAWVPALQN